MLAELSRKVNDPQAAIEIAKQIVDLQVRQEELRQSRDRFEWEKLERESKVAFAEAFEAFKRNAPKILKTKNVSFGEGPKATNYTHVELDKACELLIPAMLKEGLTHRWKPSDLPNGWTRMTCYLRHRLGYEEEGATLAGPADQSGGKNPIQGVGSATSYLERYTLLATLGIVASNTDNDGNAEEASSETVNERTKRIFEMSRAEGVEKLTALYRANIKDALAAKDYEGIPLFDQARDKRMGELNAA